MRDVGTASIDCPAEADILGLLHEDGSLEVVRYEFGIRVVAVIHDDDPIDRFVCPESL